MKNLRKKAIFMLLAVMLSITLLSSSAFATTVTSNASSPYFTLSEISPGRFVATSDLVGLRGPRIVYEISFGANPTGYLFYSETLPQKGTDYALKPFKV